ncbi:MAG: hypothetical protein J4G05_02165 [Chlorobi bacterium]|nr:hypothetical protein [Chlorobiota bacterium]
MRNPNVLIGYLLGGSMVLVGILILTGVFKLRATWDPLFETIFGIVVLLFGVYRIVITDTKRRQDERRDLYSHHQE